MHAPPFQPPLMKHPPGTSGAAVREWQLKMRERGWNIVADGHYGPASKRICMNFQREHRLAVDGIVGPITWKAAWETAGTIPPHGPGVILHYGSVGEHVLAWERQVDSRGWRIQAIDGAFDAETESACKALQSFKGLYPTGRIDHKTWNAAWQEKVPVAAEPTYPR